MKKFNQIANRIRYETIKLVHESKTAHLGSCLSCIDILVITYFSKLLFKSKVNNKQNLKDTFILSKGHAAPALYVVLQMQGYISKKLLKTYAKPNSYLEEHPNIKTNGVLVSSGSLGHGLSYAAGIALADKIKKQKNTHIVLMSDGECNEGSTWEAAMFITGKKINNVLAFIDCNRWQATDRTNNIVKLEPMKEKWKSFGWKTYEIDGHNYQSLTSVIKKFKKSPKPTVIICRTTKGKGVSFMEDNNLWHYRSPSKEEFLRSIKELDL